MAVFTHITEEQLKQHLTQFDIGGLVSFTGINEGVENTNYKLTTTQNNFILTIFEGRTRQEDLPFFSTFMKHLHGQGIPCPDVIADKEGREVAILIGKPSFITGFLPGGWPGQIEDFHAAAVGQTLAQMHLAGASFKMQRKNTMSLPAWQTLIEACKGKSDLVPALLEELSCVEAHWPQNLPSGAVHADLFPDNVFFSGQKLTGVIDFYFSCTDVFAYDLMLTLNPWCFGKDGLNRKRAAQFLAAYEAVRPLSAAEKQSLDFFGRAAALRIIATRLYDWLHRPPGAAVTPKDPLEHVRILNFYQKESLAA